MDVFDAITRRLSYRGVFQDKPVPRVDLRRIVQAGLQAPSGKNLQSTTFVIVDDPELVNMMNALHQSNVAMRQARAFIACVIDKDPEPVYHGHSFQIEDCAAAVENILLAVTALGYATVWIDGWLRLEDHAERIGKALDLPREKIIRVLLPIGIPEEVVPRKEKKPFEERAWFNSYKR